MGMPSVCSGSCETKTDLEICLISGGNSERTELLTSSYIGLYDTPVLEIKPLRPNQLFWEKSTHENFLKTQDQWIQIILFNLLVRIYEHY